MLSWVLSSVATALFNLLNSETMIPSPNKLLSSAIALSSIATIAAFSFGGMKMGLGVLIASAVLCINLFLWNVVVRALVQQAAYGTTSKANALFFILKLLVLGIGIFAMATLLSPLYVLVANTIIVTSLIGISLSTIYQSRLR